MSTLGKKLMDNQGKYFEIIFTKKKLGGYVFISEKNQSTLLSMVLLIDLLINFWKK